MNLNLPGGFLNSGDLAFVGELAEANAAEVKIAKISPLSSTLETSVNSPGTEFGLFFRTRDNRCFCHLSLSF